MISKLINLGAVEAPSFNQQQRVYMHPVTQTLPDAIKRWAGAIAKALSFAPMEGGWITLDEKHIKAGETHRRAGAHVDGNFYGAAWGSGRWQRNDHTGGLFLLANAEGSCAYTGEIDAEPTPWLNEGSPDSASDGGDCQHMDLSGLTCHRLLPNILYWMNSGGIHESLPLVSDTDRSLLRITLPHNCPQLAC